MIEDWKHALDKNLVVYIVFVDFRKAFNSISRHALSKKFQAVGVAGHLCCWIKDSLADPFQGTVAIGFQSETLPVKFDAPQGSVLGPTLFSLFCNDQPEIVEDCDGKIHIYADDNTNYVAASSPDMVAFVMNVLFQKLNGWWCLNYLISHPGKTEYMILIRGQFVGPLQAVLLGNSLVTKVKPTRFLGIEIDSDLNWNVHVRKGY